MMRSLLGPFDQGEGLGPRRLPAQTAADGRGYRHRSRFLHPAHGQAEVFGFGDDQYPFRFDTATEDVGRVRGQSLLRGRPPGQGLDHPGQMRKPGDLVAAGNIGDMGLAEKRQQMMLADRIKGNIADDDQFVAVLGGVQRDLFAGVLTDAGENLFVKLGHPLRRLEQPLALGGLLRSPPGSAARRR